MSEWRLTMLSDEYFLVLGLPVGAARGAVACIYT